MSLRLVKVWIPTENDCRQTNAALACSANYWFISLKSFRNDNYLYETYCWLRTIQNLIEWSTK